MTSNYGGVESFLVNYYRRFDHSKIIFDFITNSSKPIAYEEELLKYGSHIFRIEKKSGNYLKYRKQINDFFKENAHEYLVIWQNSNILSNIDYLKYAKKYGIKYRIIHSHNTHNIYHGYIRLIRSGLHLFNRYRISLYANNFWACSKSAANYFYNHDISKKVKVIPNAINIKKVQFSKNGREKIRKQFSLKRNQVIGNVGRLSSQKNQLYILKVFKKALKIKPNLKLILVGDGEDKKMLVDKVNQWGIQNKVIFTGIRTDISDLLSSFDIFLFPSLFEGLSVATIEAQSNGVPILGSCEAITDENRINKNIKILSLKENEDLWVKTLLNMLNESKRLNSNVAENNVRKAGFDIESASKKLEQFFVALSDKEQI